MSVWNEGIIICPSLITLDMTSLATQVQQLEAAGVKMLHIDILDGHFSPSMPLGLDTVRQLRAKTSLPFDCHVMTTRPDFFVDELLDIGVEQVVFQIETCDHVDGMLNRIHAAGARAGVALRPATSLACLDYVLEKCDTVLLMLINPGFAQVRGEKQVSYATRKVCELHKRIERANSGTLVEIDGRISPSDIREYGSQGLVQLFVAGSTCIDRNDIAGSMSRLATVCAEAEEK